jgi:hypothetical protein
MCIGEQVYQNHQESISKLYQNSNQLKPYQNHNIVSNQDAGFLAVFGIPVGNHRRRYEFDMIGHTF